MANSKKLRWNPLLTAILLTVLACVAYAPAQGAFIRVPDDSPTIQGAINGASPGDTIAVRPSPSGNYNEHIEINKQLVLLGGWNETFTERPGNAKDPAGLALLTLVDAGGGGHTAPQVVRFGQGLDKSTVLDGFALKGGRPTQGVSALGGGIYCFGTSPTIRNNEVYGNIANFGAGIALLDGSDADIIDNYIHDNTEITSSGIAGCGIYSRRSEPYITGNLVDSNKGSGIRCEGSDALIEGNTIIENTHGAGVACLDGSDAVVRNNILRENRAVYGGGVWIEDSSPLVELNVFDRNTIQITEGKGGGAGLSALGDFGSPVVRSNIFKGNWTTAGGGGIICMGDATPTIEKNVFLENRGDDEGGGITVRDNAGAAIKNNTFFRNRSAVGGTIHVTGTADATLSNNVIFGSPLGGGIRVDQQGSVTLDCNCVSNNLPANYIGVAPGATDIMMNPIFCRTDGDTLDLASNSPCLPENNPLCDELIGAFGMGNCGAFPTNLSLVQPPDGAILNFDTPEFRWMDSHDPDGGQVTFELEYDTLGTFATATLVDTGTDTSYTILPGNALREGKRYYWHAIATDDEGAHTSSDQVWSLLVDMTKPDLTLGVHQHPYLDSYLDFYVVADEELSGDLDASLTIGGSQQDLDMELLDPDEELYYSSFKMQASGTVELEVTGVDLAGNSTLEERSFTFQVLRPGTGASFTSPDGELAVLVREGSFFGQTYFLVKSLGDSYDAAASLAAGPGTVEQAESLEPAGGRDQAVSPVYSVTWSPSASSVPVVLKFRSDSYHAESASICRWTGQEWEPLATYTDPESGDLFCQTSTRGMFQLRSSTGGHSIGPTTLLQNYPNPFRGITTVAFTVGETQGSPSQVSIKIFDVKGRLVRRLLDADLGPGPYAVTWDGRHSNGAACPAGLYLYRLEVKGEAPISKKMLLMR